MRIVLAVLIKRPLDRLLDPIAGVGGEAGADGRVEPSTARSRPEVAFLDQVLQAEALAGVAAGDVDHQPQVRADHAVAGLRCRRCRWRWPVRARRRPRAARSR